MSNQPKHFEIDFINDDHKKKVEIPYIHPLLGKKTIYSYEGDETEGAIPVIERIDGQIWIAELTSVTRHGENPRIKQIQLYQHNLNVEGLESLDNSLQAHLKN